jgi:inorganic phosphate transporter, PiT family
LGGSRQVCTRETEHLLELSRFPFRVHLMSCRNSSLVHATVVSIAHPEFAIPRSPIRQERGIQGASPMADFATTVQDLPHGESLLDRKRKMPKWVSGAIILIALIGGLGYVGLHVAGDLGSVTMGSAWPYVLLGTALAIALGFEFVNGFHDTANAVATVIYTHSLNPNIAVVWSGLCNLVGVLSSAGTVAFTIITLLPVELILKVSSGAGFAMVFSLLIAAILWNLGTWYLGLPASSTHTMTGSIIGVGVANQLLANAPEGTSGVDWEQALKVFKVLLVSPLVGFGCAALLFLLAKALVRYPELYEAPKDNTPPPFPIRVLLVLTCTGVSFFHGSNDGQKGMGLIMLILIGTIPTAYALNHAVSAHDIQDFIAASERAGAIVDRHVNREAILAADARSELIQYLRTKKIQPVTMTALRELIQDLKGSVQAYGDYKNVPAAQQTNVRNDMYVTSETIRLMGKNHQGTFSPDETAALNNYKKTCRQGHQVHSLVGEGSGCAGARVGNNGGLETHRGHSWRRNRQRAPYLCPGRYG